MNSSEESRNVGQEAQAELEQESSDAASKDAAGGGPADAESQALIDELNTLGAKLADAMDAAWRSEQRKRLEEDLRTGVTRVATSLEQHLKEFSQREEARKVLDKAEDVADKVRSSKVSQEIAAALTQGLRALSDQLDKLARDIRERDTTGSDQGDGVDSARSEGESNEDIPIQRG